jgi:hypothetical protein
MKKTLGILMVGAAFLFSAVSVYAADDAPAKTAKKGKKGKKGADAPPPADGAAPSTPPPADAPK